MRDFFKRLLSLDKRSHQLIPNPATRVLQGWEADVERGKDASFRGWTFFDTCCLSDLVKMADGGDAERVRNFVSGRDIALPINVLQELHRAPKIANRVPDVFASANLFFIPHPTKFWDCDLWNFLNIQRVRRNVLEAYPISPGKFRLIVGFPDLVFDRAERYAAGPFRAQIERDRNVGVHDRMLVSMVWGKANELMQKQYGRELPVGDCRPENFPSIFTYYYAYYFRFLVHRHVVPQPNDFIDLAHATIAPYCRDFYGEQKLVQMLRKQVKGRIAPTPYAVARRLFAEELIDSTRHEQARRSEHMRRETLPLLLDTNLMTQREMRQAVLAS